jgi:glycosyltransferase involved in cell wall biosynthesis
MRILSVVTLVTPDGAYGGPVRVAVNQARALRELGHEVTLAAATRGFAEPLAELDGVPVRLFPARTILPGTGFAGLGSPGLLRWLRMAVKQADVVHVHAARDLVTLPAAGIAGRAGVPYFLQTHGMIDPSTNPLAAPLDALLTRPLLRSAAGVFHLTELERDQLDQVAGELRFHELANGVPFAEAGEPALPPEVLYLARLAPRKRPLAFVEAAHRVHANHPDATFALVGPDEGEGPAVRRAVDEAAAEGVPIAYEGALAPEATLDRLRRAGVYVLPSVDEPYPMSVLEALSVARPVVVTDTCGLAAFVTGHRAGLVTDAGVDSLTDAISALLADPAEAAATGRRGQQAVRTELSMEAIAAQLAAHYAAATAS